MTRKFFIYKLLDENENLLYVGQTSGINSPNSRPKQHRSTHDWGKDIMDILVAEVTSKSAMDMYEVYLINKFKPKYNTTYNRKDEIPFELPELPFKDISKFEEKKATIPFKRKKFDPSELDYLYKLWTSIKQSAGWPPKDWPTKGILNMEMPFGKYKGREVKSIPEDYLEWLWKNAKLYGPLRIAVACARGTYNIVDYLFFHENGYASNFRHTLNADTASRTLDRFFKYWDQLNRIDKKFREQKWELIKLLRRLFKLHEDWNKQFFADDSFDNLPIKQQHKICFLYHRINKYFDDFEKDGRWARLISRRSLNYKQEWRTVMDWSGTPSLFCCDEHGPDGGAYDPDCYGCEGAVEYSKKLPVCITNGKISP